MQWYTVDIRGVTWVYTRVSRSVGKVVVQWNVAAGGDRACGKRTREVTALTDILQMDRAT